MYDENVDALKWRHLETIEPMSSNIDVLIALEMGPVVCWQD